jgi:predicted small lipoprotein YifL
VRTLLTLVLLVAGFGLAGCGGPDPRDNPNFDQAAYDDVDASSKALSEDDAVSR